MDPQIALGWKPCVVMEIQIRLTAAAKTLVTAQKGGAAAIRPKPVAQTLANILWYLCGSGLGCQRSRLRLSGLLNAVQELTIPCRPDRSDPRVVKRRLIYLNARRRT